MAWALLCIYFLSILRVYQPYINYSVNYKYISSVLCVNKEKPSVHCNGKCYLSKELKKTAEEESQKKSVAQKVIEVETIPAGTEFLSATMYTLISALPYPMLTEVLSSVSIGHITPPPRA